MESTKESIHMGLVQRACTLGLAVLATSFIFTSVAAIVTAATLDAASTTQFAQATVRALAGV